LAAAIRWHSAKVTSVALLELQIEALTIDQVDHRHAQCAQTAQRALMVAAGQHVKPRSASRRPTRIAGLTPKTVHAAG
jgi:hypothetical protein